MNDDQTATQPDSMDQFRRLLDVLQPPDDVIVTDGFGTTHRLSCSVPARQQIKILRIFERVKDLPVASQLQGIDSGGFAGAIILLATDADVLAALAEVFQLAHPRAYGEASAKAHDLGHEFEDAADLFPIEELVAAIVPLFGRLVHRSAGAIQALDAASLPTSTTSG